MINFVGMEFDFEFVVVDFSSLSIVLTSFMSEVIRFQFTKFIFYHTTFLTFYLLIFGASFFVIVTYENARKYFWLFLLLLKK